MRLLPSALESTPRLVRRGICPRHINIQASTTHCPRFKHIDEAERLDSYVAGGFHPIRINDIFHDRYRIVHKLGYGSYSTIWLARDERLSKYVAVKVGIADSGRQEINILSRLAHGASWGKRLEGHLIPSVLDQFDVEGPNGTNPCIVTTPAACSLADAQDAVCRFFPTNVARSLAAQLALAVAYMHTMGVVHGDLHLGNLLLQLPSNIDILSDQQLYDRYRPPQPEPVLDANDQPFSSPRVPSHVYPPIWMGQRCSDVQLHQAKLLVADFGTAFQPDHESRTMSYAPLDILPPETKFEPEKPLGYASDVWSLGCVMWAILDAQPLLGGWLFGLDDAIAIQMELLGPLPDEWWDGWKAEEKTQQFESNGKSKDSEQDVWTLEQRFDDIQANRRQYNMDTQGDDERQAFLDMVRGMLVFRPESRLTAQQVLQTEWMTRWGIPQANVSRRLV